MDDDSGREKYPILSLPGDICFEGCQKYFSRPLEPPFEISAVKVQKLAMFSLLNPNDELQPLRLQPLAQSLFQEGENSLFCASHEKFYTAVFKGGRNLSDALPTKQDLWGAR